MNRLIIDFDGTLRPLHEVVSGSFHAEHSSPNTLADFMIFNQGVIVVSRKAEALHLRLDRDRATLAALLGVTRLVLEQEPLRVVAQFPSSQGSGTVTEIIGGSAMAERWLARLVAKRTGGDTPVLVADRAVSSPGTHPSLKRVLAVWQSGPKWRTIAEAEAWANELLRQQYLLMLAAPTDDRDVRIEAVGAHFASCARKTLQAARGASPAETPDRRYGYACLEHYREALRRNEPVLQDVDAFVYWPGHSVQRRRYQRLLLPIRLKGQQNSLLLSTSRPDARVDLRRQPN